VINIQRIDHLVLTVRDIQVTCEFYTRILGMQVITFGDSPKFNGKSISPVTSQRTALQFGQQKINLHELGHEFEPKATYATPGSADICLITSTPLSQAREHIINCGVEIIEGIVTRTGALGKIDSIYLYDPDGNLIEISNYRNNNQNT
jgi:catechol 2,3-dioxygenase-like lactoylglutathione lyase family enzyme